MTFAKKLKAAREAKGLTEHDAATLIHSRAPLIRSWEAGKKEPAVEIQERVLALLASHPVGQASPAPPRQKPGPKPGEGGRESTGRDKPGPRVSDLTLARLRRLADYGSAKDKRIVSMAEALEMAVKNAEESLPPKK